MSPKVPAINKVDVRSQRVGDHPPLVAETVLEESLNRRKKIWKRVPNIDEREKGKVKIPVERIANIKELEIISIKIDKIDITVGFMGKTTVAVANVNGTTGLGMAMCIPADKYSKDIGTGIAVARALRNAADVMEEVWSGRAISKKEYQRRHR